MDGSESTFVAHRHLGALLFATFKKETKQVQSRKTPVTQEDTHSAQMKERVVDSEARADPGPLNRLNA